MILFKPQFVQSILNGQKTQTRRLGVKRWNVGSIHQTKTNFSEESAFAKVMITQEPYQQELRMMSSSDALAEGGFTIHDSCKNKTIDKIYARMACKKCNHKETCYQLVWITVNGTWRPKENPWVVNFQRIREKVQNNIRITNTVII